MKPRRVVALAMATLVALLTTACAHRPGKAPPLSPVASNLAESITIQAIGLVGTPYRYGGNTPSGGFDCSGLIGYVYREGAGVALPRTVRALAEGPWPEVARRDLVSGDLVFFAVDGRTPSHAGIYVGEGRFVHAPSSGGTVRLDRLDAGYWQERLRLGRRLLR
ncbi:C40 family peptidase [Pseudofulvimonas gallinarii]|jgi:cell wall-associated NlpC family hydrolase|uniref:Cell wall-associated NlpC family hydrolase n=1 Tax=Pseudofulvimonas gallinarii TaxID=634155 RepID=A0A4R3LM72_9GAMM|nr:C40 family peptidase [Pseudofulvimonas gallinarii]TCT01402.1 cell wall-associated NlpC family hydrolase [Pseudofulvimonas gallinarii]THD15152.1 hydrolase Nlp/P60 [Pseudofulvimonas gallinarii]